jgi:hypothetical protein
MLLAVLPRPGVEPVDKPPYTSGASGDFGPIVDQLLRWVDSHEFLGDAIPFYYMEFGPDHFASLLGAELRFPPDAPRTSWAVPFVEDWDAEELRFRPECRWWERTAEFARAIRSRCDGKLLIASSTLVANLDALAAVRGPQRLLMDLVERPDAVRRALDQVTGAHQEILDAFADLLDYTTWGSINRHGLYSRGRINVPQCDFSCMISPAMFREFAIPALREEMDHLDAVEYHLDGPDAIGHLEALCEIEALDIVQWVPGSGEASTQDWTWLYDRIDALGKGQIRGGSAESIKHLWERYGSRKLVAGLSAGSRQEVEACIEALERSG